MKQDSIENKAEKTAKSFGHYNVRDGIAYCDLCGQPLQKKIAFGDREKLVWCTCPCRDKQANKSNAERIEKLQKLGGVSPNCTFDRAQPSRPVDVCRRYASRWDDAEKRGAGLLLWGGVGTGKTFAAHCIANELIGMGIPVLITSLSLVMNSGFDRTAILRRIRETPLVCFDDLGVERSSEYALETVFLLVDERYRSGRPLIVTTNLTERELHSPQDIDRKRIYDRILERCAPLHFDGGSKREEQAAEMRKFMKELLEG